MHKYVDIEKAKEYVNLSNEAFISLKGFCIIPKDTPAADVAPVVHGYWKDIYQRDIYIPDEKTTMTLTEEKCSNCRIVTKFIGDKLFLPDFVCPNCGAKMDRRK